jgi:hypothetical protein
MIEKHLLSQMFPSQQQNAQQQPESEIDNLKHQTFTLSKELVEMKKAV